MNCRRNAEEPCAFKRGRCKWCGRARPKQLLPKPSRGWAVVNTRGEIRRVDVGAGRVFAERMAFDDERVVRVRIIPFKK